MDEYTGKSSYNIQGVMVSEKDIGQLRLTKWKIFVTVTMTLSMISMGMFLEISGPTLPYLKDRLGVNMEEVSRALVARSVGYFIGSIFGGLLCDAFPALSHLYFSSCYLLAAIGTAAAPWCQTLELLGLMFCLQGIGQGCICTGLNAIVLKMWGEKGSPALVSQHFGFGIGALTAPQLANAFIFMTSTEPEDDSGTNITTTSITVMSSMTSPAHVTTESQSTRVEEHIEYPYMIIAITCAFFSIAFLFIYLMESFYKPLKALMNKSDQEEMTFKELLKLLSPSSCTEGHPIFGTVFFIFFAILFIHIVGGERAMSKFLYSFATESTHNFSPSDASTLNSAFWFSFTSGRAINMAAAIFCPPNILFITEILFNILNSLVLAIWGASNVTVLWVFTCSYGLFLSPLFPTALVWANQYVKMTAMGVSVGYVGSAVGGMIYQWLTGYLFEYHGPVTMMYVLFGCSINLTVIYAILQVLGSRHGNRLKLKTGPSQQLEENMDKF